MNNWYADNDGRFPDDSEVLVRFPLDPAPEGRPRDTWPWVSGYVAGQCGPNEWDIVVDGSHPTDWTAAGQPLYPAVYRDATEIRSATTGNPAAPEAAS